MGQAVKGSIACLVAVLTGWLLFSPLSESSSGEAWRSLSRGVEYGVFPVQAPSRAGKARIHVVRIDPSQAALKLVLASEQDRERRTLGGWCEDFRLTVATNAGMFLKDYSTNVGYLRNGAHVQNKRWNKKYKSVLAFDPKEYGIPSAIMVDLDDPGAVKRLEGYRAVIQNLRLIKGTGINVWERSEKRWSEAAVGMDHEGRLLFVYCATPFSMWEFNERIKSLGLGVARLMHMEGGPVAGLSIRAKEFTLDLAGGFDPLSGPSEIGAGQWPIPNVIGVKPR